MTTHQPQLPPPIPQSDVRRQYRALKDAIDAAVHRVLDRGWFILGEEVEAFEREFAAYTGAGHAVGVANGTDALELAFRAAGAGPGDEIIVPVNTAFPTAAAVVAAGATPVFADIDRRTQTLDPADVARRITARTRVIVPVHLYGYPADLDALEPLAAQAGAVIVEDAAQAHGTRLSRGMAGTRGVAGCFSFYPSKNLGAFGDGGLILARDAEGADRLKMLRNYGQRRRYHHDEMGFNSRLDELQAAVLRAKLPHLNGWVERRRYLASRYRAALEGTGVGLPASPEQGEHSYHLFVIRTNRREALMAHLASHGIHTLIHFPVPLHLQGAFKMLGLREGEFPVAEELSRQIVSLPLFPELTEDEVERVTDAIREFQTTQ